MGSVYELGQIIFVWPTERVLWNEQTVQWYYDKAKALCFVAKYEQAIIGFVLCWVSDAVGRVEWIAVDEKFQHMGVATELLRRALLAFRLNKITHISTLAKEDGRANQFFTQNGFRESGAPKSRADD